MLNLEYVFIVYFYVLLLKIKPNHGYFQLLAANRSWAVQYNLMKEKYSEQILRLKDEVHTMKKEKQEKNRESQETKEEKVTITSDVQNQINMLTHQVNNIKICCIFHFY